MELKALCDFCGRPAIVHSCRFCGARVCSEHFNTELGLCFKCAAKMDRGRKPDNRKS